MLLTINQQREIPNYKLGALSRKGRAIYCVDVIGLGNNRNETKAQVHGVINGFLSLGGIWPSAVTPTVKRPLIGRRGGS